MSFGALASVSVFAADPVDTKSSNWQAQNTVFGAGGEQACSDSYCSKQSVGDTAVGDSSSANYRSQAGSNSTPDPILEVNVQGSINDLGILSTGATATAQSDLSVRSYLSSGYVVQVVGTPPKMYAHTINALSSPSDSQAGTEQFGINLVTNTSPAVGKALEQIPDSTFAFGVIDANYNTPNKFMYHEGDIVARSNVSSGQTNYTISFILNISSSTPAGLYVGRFHAIVVPTY